MEMCRACLSDENDLFQVEANFISSYNLLTNLNVNLYDSMPKRFCRACMESVTFFIAFRDKCISSESTLQEKKVSFKVDECAIEVDIKRESVNNLDENWQYELADFSLKDEVKTEVCVVTSERLSTETETSPEKERNPLELEKVVKKPRGRPKAQARSRKIKQSQKLKGIEDNFYCGICDESFIFLDDLNKHLNDHMTDKQCGICSKTFVNWPKLLAHRTIHSSRKYCHLCPRRFHSALKLEQHYLQVHFKEKVDEMCCEHCQKKFTCPEKFSKHTETHNVGCEICSEVCLSRRSLLLHMRTHDTEKRYECDQCEYTAVYADVLFRHKSRRHKKYACKTCDRKFATRSAMKIHKCKEKSKICPVCGKLIFNSFTRHLKSHQDKKGYKCEKCSASYKSSFSLKIHMDRHANNPTHECDYCARKFYYPTTLTKHRRVHTGEKPYVCKICAKRFTGNNNLRVHMKVHGYDDIYNKKSKNPAGVSEVEQATSS